MGELFQANEILKTAIKIEQNGIIFYTEMASVARKSRVKDVFEHLADQERVHYHNFSKLQEKVSFQRVRETYSGEQEEYLAALAATHVFIDDSEIKEIMSRTESDIEVIALAQCFEKDSILFYLEMINFIPEEDQAQVRKLIEQERDHLRQLNRLKKDLLRFENNLGEVH